MRVSVVDITLWASISTAERYTGWLALSFALTLAAGNPLNVLWKIAEHGTGRAAWAAMFMLLGIALLLAPHWRVQRTHFVLNVVSAFFWAFFGMQAYSIGAIGAAMIAGIATTYMGLSARTLYQRD